MDKLSRRKFLGLSTAGIGSAILASKMPMDLNAAYLAGKVKLPIGFQTWTLREQIAKDFPGTLKMMAKLGYQTLEMCSPPGYEGAGFGPLMKLKPKEMKQIINDAGLTCDSSHYGFGELRDHLDERIEFALESGQSQMILASFWLPENSTVDDWLKAADELNVIGEKTKKAGIQTAYHNHHMEFAKIGDTLIYDAIMGRFDPEFVRMQFQVAVISIGYKAADYFNKYPGRFISAHLADWSKQLDKQVPIGQGDVDWVEFFENIKKGGVKNIFVEMDPETFEASAKFLKQL
jgi:sugar phosphate isomerase/epimerase